MRGSGTIRYDQLTLRVLLAGIRAQKLLHSTGGLVDGYHYNNTSTPSQKNQGID